MRYLGGAPPFASGRLDRPCDRDRVDRVPRLARSDVRPDPTRRRRPPTRTCLGFFLPEATSFVLLAVALLVGGSVLWQRIPPTKRGLFLVFAVVFAAAFRLAVHAVRTAALPGAEFLFYPGEDVFFDVSRISSIGAFLRDYTDLQPDLSLHGRTKPPGFALIHYGIQSWVGDNVEVVGSLLTCAASLIVLPVFYLGKALRGKLEDGRVCAMLAATAPSLVSFGAVSLDAIYAVIAATIFLVALLELRQPDRLLRIGLGLLLFLAMMLSYSTFIMGFFVASTLILERFRRPRACAVHLVQILAGSCSRSCGSISTTASTRWPASPVPGAQYGDHEASRRSAAHRVRRVDLLVGRQRACVLDLSRATDRRVLVQAASPTAHAGGTGLCRGVLPGVRGRLFRWHVSDGSRRVLLFLVPGATVLAVLSPGFAPRRRSYWLAFRRSPWTCSCLPCGELACKTV